MVYKVMMQRGISHKGMAQNIRRRSLPEERINCCQKAIGMKGRFGQSLEDQKTPPPPSVTSSLFQSIKKKKCPLRPGTLSHSLTPPPPPHTHTHKQTWTHHRLNGSPLTFVKEIILDLFLFVQPSHPHLFHTPPPTPA